MRLRSIGLLLASSALCLPAPATVLGSVGDLSSHTVAQIKHRHDLIIKHVQTAQQDDDYLEFFLDQPSGPFGEDQWFEITPEFADMYPDGGEGDDDIYDLSSHVPSKGVSALNAILKRYKSA